jgi:hypothetical protein
MIFEPAATAPAAHRPFAAAHAVPWPGEIAVFRSRSTDGFELLTSFGTRAHIGTLVSVYTGPTSRFDLGDVLVVDLLSGTLESVTDLTLFGGANALAIESATGTWEIVQAGTAELIAPGRYRLTRLLRGQRGTEGAMGSPAPAGTRVVVLDDSLASLPNAAADLASRGTGSSAPRAGRSATKPMWSRPSRPRILACGRSPSPMSSSRGVAPARRAS